MWPRVTMLDLNLMEPFTAKRAHECKRENGMPGFIFFDAGSVVMDLDWDSYFDAIAQLVKSGSANFTIERFVKSMLSSGLARQWSCGLVGNAVFAAGLKKLLVEEFNVKQSDADAIYPQHLKHISSIIVGPPRRRVFELINMLKQKGFLIGLLSNCNPWHEIDIERHKTLYDAFEVVIYSHDVGCEKPEVEIYDVATRMAQSATKTKLATTLAKQDIYFVDDTPANVIAAREFGWNSSLVGIVHDNILQAAHSGKISSTEFENLSTRGSSLIFGDAASRRVEALFAKLLS